MPEVKMKLNVPIDQIVENVKVNIRRGLPQVQPHDVQETPIAVVGGGWSLNETLDDLKEKHAAGMKVVSVNGSHDYLIQHGIRPSAHVQLDAREFNARFVRHWHPDCKYLIASQCHPSVFDALEGADVRIFHCENDAEKEALDNYYLGHYHTVPGGSTVMLRAILLMRMLGFDHMEVYGFDSCYRGDEHHAYPQEENEEEDIGAMTVDGREFRCAPWMFSQAKEFIGFTKQFGGMINLIVHGDGLIAHMIKTCAMRVEEK